MEQSTIALIIMVITIIVFATEKIPMAVASILSAFAMAATGCISYNDAFAGFSNTAVLMVIGLCIVGEAFFTTGFSDRIGQAFLRINYLSERKFILYASVASAALSAFLNGLVVIAMFLPIIDCLAAKTNGAIKKKHAYLPVAIGAVFGGNLSNVGSSSMISASGMMADSYAGRTLDFLEPAPLGLAGTLVFVVLLALLGTKLQDRFFDFEEENVQLPKLVDPQKEELKEFSGEPAWKRRLVLVVLAGTMLAFMMGASYGAFSLLAACLLIAFGCIDFNHAISGVSWSTVLVVVGTLGFAKGVQESGAAEVISNTVLGLAGPFSGNAYVMAVIFLLLATAISNFMSNNATVGILTPVALSIAYQLNASPAAFVLACAIGANLSVMTPICTSTITVTASCGYRFKDYVRFGGIFNVLAFLATALMMKIIYF